MNNKDLENFLYTARAKTYAGDGGKVASVLAGSSQLEYAEDKWIYRDIYYTGKNNFTGLEAVYFEGKPVFSMCYYGNWGEMTENEIDDILRGALMFNPETRSYKPVRWEKDGFVYDCSPDTDSFYEVSGSESISKNGEQIYYLYYAGSVLV
jgi:hypothetical protein